MEIDQGPVTNNPSPGEVTEQAERILSSAILRDSPTQQRLFRFLIDETLARWERGYVEAALELSHGNLSRAAKLLGVNRTTLYSRMQNYGSASGDKAGGAK